jgi:phosphoglycolate phosphatase-like HAD superfamily hydrolase
MAKAVAFDFDGLLVDGLNECVLVCWNGFHDKDIGAFSPAGLDAVPADFIDTFKNHRNFASQLGHFVTPFLLPQSFRSQSEFDAAFRTLEPRVVEDFVIRVSGYRKLARQTHFQLWLRYHVYYPGIERLLRKIACPLYIVSGKDEASIDELLRGANIVIPAGRISGGCRDKVPVLQQIADREGVDPMDISFFDDNVMNACRARENGFASYWATWGYQAPDHPGLAHAAGVTALSLDEFVTMDFGAGGRAIRGRTRAPGRASREQ